MKRRLHLLVRERCGSDSTRRRRSSSTTSRSVSTLAFGEIEIDHAVGLELHHQRQPVLGDALEIGGVVMRGEGVVLAAVARHRLGQFAGGHVLGALEHQMLEEMRRAREAGRIVGAADAEPQHVRDDGRAVIFDHHDLHAVGELELGRLLAGLLRRPGRARRGFARCDIAEEDGSRDGKRSERLSDFSHRRALGLRRGRGWRASPSWLPPGPVQRAAGVVPAGWLSRRCAKSAPEIFLTDVGGDPAADVGSTASAFVRVSRNFSPSLYSAPSAAAWSAAFCGNSASRASPSGSGSLRAAAPGCGGRRLKSGGMTSGALVSDGEFIGRVLGGADRGAERGAAAQRQPNRRQRHELRRIQGRISPCLFPGCRLPVRVLCFGSRKGVHKKRHDTDRDGGVGHIEYIPVAAKGMKVEKIGHRPIDGCGRSHFRGPPRSRGRGPRPAAGGRRVLSHQERAATATSEKTVRMMRAGQARRPGKAHRKRRDSRP